MAMYFQSEKDWYKRALGNADASIIVFFLLVLFPLLRVVVLLVGENGFCFCPRCRSSIKFVLFEDDDCFVSFASSPRAPSAIRIPLFSLAFARARFFARSNLFGLFLLFFSPPRILKKKLISHRETYLNGFWRHNKQRKAASARERSESERAFTCARAHVHLLLLFLFAKRRFFEPLLLLLLFFSPAHQRNINECER